MTQQVDTQIQFSGISELSNHLVEQEYSTAKTLKIEANASVELFAPSSLKIQHSGTPMGHLSMGQQGEPLLKVGNLQLGKGRVEVGSGRLKCNGTLEITDSTPDNPCGPGKLAPDGTLLRVISNSQLVLKVDPPDAPITELVSIGCNGKKMSVRAQYDPGSWRQAGDVVVHSDIEFALFVSCGGGLCTMISDWIPPDSEAQEEGELRVVETDTVNYLCAVFEDGGTKKWYRL